MFLYRRFLRKLRVMRFKKLFNILPILLFAYLGILLIFSRQTKKSIECVFNEDRLWSWECRNKKCVKIDADSQTRIVELDTCKLTCGTYSMLFPKPSGQATFGKETVPFIPTQVQLVILQCDKSVCDPKTQYYMNNAFNLFQNQLQETYSKQAQGSSVECTSQAHNRKLLVSVSIKHKYEPINLQTDESYSLSIKETNKSIDVTINAKTFQGARHGFETVSQLSAYLRSYNSMQILTPVEIVNDKPAYKYRGLLLDTSRNYFSVKSILRLITAMSYNKMNTLHWHITDTHSFPLEIKSVPDMLKYGAYDPKRVYTHNDVRKIVEHAALNGIRVLPEFDQPAHCGEGWQWGPKARLGNLTVCFNKEPWSKYCVEPPCGQLNPINDNVYIVLAKIYKEYFDLFNPDIFHAGGDEININCWNTTKEITGWLKTNYGGVTEKNFMDMWGMFLKKSSKEIYKANKDQTIPLVLWTSKMTEYKYLKGYLDPKKHIIQIWTASTDRNVAYIVQNGFRTIFSTHDTVYLDCGYGHWLTSGNNWCSPYKDWRRLYDSNPVKSLMRMKINITEKIRASILGQEAAMWSEQVDEASSESKIWPRTAALAERLWSNPDHNWIRAQERLIYHRERLVERGIQADALQPLWCKQNPKYC